MDKINWIPKKDGMPFHKPILVTNGKDYCVVEIKQTLSKNYISIPEKSIFSMSGDYEPGFTIDEITHWAELELPK